MVSQTKFVFGGSIKSTANKGVLTLFLRFLIDFIFCLPFINKEFKKTYNLCLKEDFYTFSFCTYFFEQKFKGVIEIKTGKKCEFKIMFENFFYPAIKLLPKSLMEPVLESLIKQIYFQGLRKILPEKKILKIQKNEYIKTVNAPKNLKKQLEKDIFQILINFYLQSGQNSFVVHTSDILKFKNTTKKKVEKAFFNLQKEGLIFILKNFDTHFYISLIYFEAEFFTLPVKLFLYSAKTQLWQRQIGEFLYKNNSPLKIKNILKEVEDNFKVLKPSQIRERLENTLDKLLFDNIISAWEYKFINEDKLTGKNWLLKYKNLSINFKK